MNADARVMTYVGGPHDGQTSPPIIPAASPWPYESCRRTNGVGAWQHYAHVGDGTYQHQGRCVGIDHDGPGPGDFRCCCQDPKCDNHGRWP